MAKIEFLSPVGRIVSGDPWTPSTTDINGNPRTIKAGPNMGQTTQEYYVHLAVDKRDPELLPFLSRLYAFARQCWPQHFNGPPGWPDNGPSTTNPNMSLKWMDGDGLDGNGQPNAGKEGYAGHVIIKTASAYPPKVFYKDHYAPHEEIKDKNLVVTGDYVRIGGMLDTNNFPTKPGVKVYLGQVALWGKGTPIVSGPNAAQVFGAAAGGFTPQGMQALPAGGMPAALPIAGGQPAPLAMPGQPAAMPTGQPATSLPGGFAPPAGQAAQPMAMPGMPAQQPAVYVAPNPALMAGPGAMAMPGQQPQPLQMAQPGAMPGLPALPMQMTPPTPVVPQLTPTGAASGLTYQQMIAQGYTDAVLRQGGYIV